MEGVIVNDFIVDYFGMNRSVTSIFILEVINIYFYF